ncbi:MAG: S-layer homology domain-containing protein, partial [Lachnospiraceae bacterium]|nr:S-layer homology domain-containing protein [Lachnospiraceae bacterium]
TVTVQDEDGTVLTEGTDYTLTFTGNQINAQSVKAIVSGKGKYTGVLAPIYTIQPAPLTKLELKQESMVYTGAKLCPEETVTNSAGTVLIKDTDYQVSYSKNVNAGEATITVSGLKNYTGSLSATFTIVPTSISDVTVSLETTSYVYDGKEKKPNVTVKNALGLTLSPETDYTVSYENNINKGTATVKVTGKGNYSGTKTATFSITAAPLQSMALEAESMVYTGKELKPNVTVKNSAGTVLTLDTDYTVSYANNIRIGTAKVTVTGKDNYTGTLEATFKIKLPFTDVPDDYAYYDELADIYMRGLMTGMTPTTFGPETTLNRAFMAAVLFRRAGYPATPYRDIFPDVKEGDWFAESALWAQASGNILGYENGKFGPTDNLLREQLCTILWRYAETTDGFDNTARADLTVYSDYTRITPYAEEAISWCVATGIFETRNGRIAAWEVATRAELALMLSRYLKVAGK